jgi:DNA-binding transcriptional regulator YdaS (Cro superfamily)
MARDHVDSTASLLMSLPAGNCLATPLATTGQLSPMTLAIALEWIAY